MHSGGKALHDIKIHDARTLKDSFYIHMPSKYVKTGILFAKLQEHWMAMQTYI